MNFWTKWKKELNSRERWLAGWALNLFCLHVSCSFYSKELKRRPQHQHPTDEDRLMDSFGWFFFFSASPNPGKSIASYMYLLTRRGRRSLETNERTSSSSSPQLMVDNNGMEANRARRRRHILRIKFSIFLNFEKLQNYKLLASIRKHIVLFTYLRKIKHFQLIFVKCCFRLPIFSFFQQDTNISHKVLPIRK